MIFVGTPASPTNHLVDLEACAALTRQYATAEKPVVAGASLAQRNSCLAIMGRLRLPCRAGGKMVPRHISTVQTARSIARRSLARIAGMSYTTLNSHQQMLPTEQPGHNDAAGLFSFQYP